MIRLAFLLARALGIVALCILGFAFIPAGCITAYVAGEAAKGLAGSDDWGFAAMGASMLITLTLLMMGEASGQ